MSNVASTAINSKKKTSTATNIPPASAKQAQFQRGTMDVLDEARNLVENAVGQGQTINPMVYQMLGIQPQVEDRTAELQQAQGTYNEAQSALDNANQTLATIQAIPKGKRSPAQRKQLKQARKAMPGINKALGAAKNTLGEVQSMPQRITGLSRMDPSQIPKESPFSPQNPLFQAQATESERLNQYLAGGEVDPTLKHQYDQAEASLRAKLSDRFGPDFETSSVGQMALQNFSREKNNAFATYNQQQVEKYNNLAFSGQANLQNLLAGQIGLMREPSRAAMEQGTGLGASTQARLEQQRLSDAFRAARGGTSTNAAGISPLAAGLQGAGNLLTNLTATGTSPTGQPQPSLIGQGISALGNWMAGGTAAAPLATGAGATAGLSGAIGDAAAAAGGEALAGETGAGILSLFGL